MSADQLTKHDHKQRNMQVATPYQKTNTSITCKTECETFQCTQKRK